MAKKTNKPAAKVAAKKVAAKKAAPAAKAPNEGPARMEILPLNLIDVNPSNPRKTFNENDMQELGKSIFANGVLQPILVRPSGDRYELVCGERRFRASVKVYGLNKDRNTIPAVIRELTDDEALELAITENLQRVDVHPMEEAFAFKQLHERRGETLEEISLRVGKSARYVALRLKLNDLIDGWKELLAAGRLNMGDAAQLCKLNPEAQQRIYEKCYQNTVLSNDEENGVVYIADYKYREAIGDLKNAPFNTESKKLSPAAGPCSTCQFNSKNQTLLFPEEEKSAGSCLNISCYERKIVLGYMDNLNNWAKKAKYIAVDAENAEEWQLDALKAFKIEHPEIVEIKNRWKYFNDNDEPIKPEEPVKPPREKWQDDEDYQLALEEYEEELKNYPDALAEYELELKRYNDFQAAGVVKAIRVDYKGRLTLENINEANYFEDIKDSAATGRGISAKAFEEKKRAGQVTDEDINTERLRIKSNHDRKIQILHNQYYHELEKLVKRDVQLTITTGDNALNREEKAALVMSIIHKFRYNIVETYKEHSLLKQYGVQSSNELAEKIIAMSDEELQSLLNTLLRYQMSQSEYYWDDHEKHLMRTTPLRLLGRNWAPSEMVELDNNLKIKSIEVEDKRAKKLEALQNVELKEES